MNIPIINQLIRRIQAETLIDKTARFIACEMIEGDYLEFGVYQGSAFISACHALKELFEDRINLTGLTAGICRPTGADTGQVLSGKMTT